MGVTTVLLIIGMSGFAYWQYQQIMSLNNQVNDMTVAKNSLSKDKAALVSKNGDLTEVVQALQTQMTQLETQNNAAQAPPAAKLAGSMTITGVKKADASTFSAPGQSPLIGQVTAIYLTIKNLTDSNQEYDVFNFNAVTSSGEAIHPNVYPGPAGENVWNNSSLVPNGSKDIALLFDQSLDLTSLEWSPPGGTAPVITTLPGSAN